MNFRTRRNRCCRQARRVSNWGEPDQENPKNLNSGHSRNVGKSRGISGETEPEDHDGTEPGDHDVHQHFFRLLEG